MTTTFDLKIQGMSCGHCVKTVDQALRAIPGVTNVQVEVGRAHVEASDTVKREALVAALAAVDYPVV